MTNKTKGKIIKSAAISLDVLVPFTATLTQFPIWIEKSSEATISGIFIVFAFLSCIPFIRQIKAYIKSPSAIVVWTILLVIFICLQNIINEMVVVCFWGALSNTVGAVLYKIGAIIEKKDGTDEKQI